MSKAKGKKGTGQKAAESDDWDEILAAEAAKNATVQSPPPVAAAASSPQPAAKADEDDDDDDEEDNADEGAAKGKDKKKKKKKAKKDEAKEAPPKQLSAVAQKIREQQEQLAAEQARLDAEREAKMKAIREEEEREAEEQRLEQERKDREKKKRQDKIALQKAEGTYMTKAEKQKKALTDARIAAMKEAGMLNVAGTEASGEKTRVVYSSKKKRKPTPGNTAGETQAASGATDDANSDDEEADGPTAAAAPVTAPEPEPVVAPAPVVDDAGDDDWESAIEAIANVKIVVQPPKQSRGGAKAAPVAIAPPAPVYVEEEVDLIEQERREEQERFRKLGLERARRDEEIRLKREAEEAERAELDRQAREAAMKKEISRKNREAKEALARAARRPENLRAAISVIMGHVDTGKTKLLDKIRHTNVQEGEAGGITQQIGATHFPKETIALQTACMQASHPFDIKLPGMLVIDTPGHESFANLRNRGSSLCDIAILVIDLMHGLEPQTVESITLLRSKNAPFIVALNKVDRLYGWKKLPDGPIREALAMQDDNCRLEFRDRVDKVTVQLNELGLNAKLYWNNDSPEDTVSLVPTSAISGEGVPDLIMNLVLHCQKRLVEKLMYTEYLQCSVLEVKVIDGLGPTIDVVLLNGTLNEGDRIAISTLDGPLITEVRALLTPPPNREMRIKSEYIHHKSLKGAMGVKIVAPNLERAVAGTPLMVINPEDDEDDVMDDVQSDLRKITKLQQTDSRGVIVHASTLGALEALLQFLRVECKPQIPVSAVSIGTVFKRDVMKAAIMRDRGLPEYAVILGFDVRIDQDAQEYAEETEVRIFTADIIYHLKDQFSAFVKVIHERRLEEARAVAVFPAVLKIFPQHVFNKKEPIVLGVEVTEGTLRVGTPLCIPQLGLDVGRVTSIQNNHRDVMSAKKGTNVAVKIVNEENPTLTYGRQFDHTSALYSKISRQSIDALKEFFKDEISKEDQALLVKLKKVFSISDKKKAAGGDSAAKKKSSDADAEED